MSQNLFSEELNAFVDEWKDKPGNLIMVLHHVQQEFGYISREAADEVSRRLNIPLAKIWGASSLISLVSTIFRSVLVPRAILRVAIS